MKKIICPNCKDKMKVIFQGKFQDEKWNPNNKKKYIKNPKTKIIRTEKIIRWTKLETKDLYRVIFRCSLKNCGKIYDFQGTDKSAVLFLVNKVRKKNKERNKKTSTSDRRDA